MTFSLETLIMVSAIVLCLGGLIGAFISRTLIPPEMQRDLEQQLNNSRSELEQYQQDVAQHFADTSKMVANLTNAYKDVHDHLAKGAIQLTNAEISKKVIEAGDGKSSPETDDAIEELAFEAPKDWAPKTSSQDSPLSEEFGLDDRPEEPGIESLTVKTKHSA